MRQANALLERHDWLALARAYNLSLTPGMRFADLRGGQFFWDSAAVAHGPGAVASWRQPFPPGSTLVEAKPLGDPAQFPCIWSLVTARDIPQGGGPVQRVLRSGRLLQTRDGFQFLPPAPTEGPSAAPPTAAEWGARGADPVLFFRPALRVRAEREVPPGRSSNILALVAAIERLRPLAATHPGAARAGVPPFEVGPVYEPSDDELLLSLAGDRIWRSLQFAPPGTLAGVRAVNPTLAVEAVEYPHIEIVRVDAAGTGPRLLARPPVVRRLALKEAAR